MKPMLWAYGLTTVPCRRDSLLPSTLGSLRRAGFQSPHLFVDGVSDAAWYTDNLGIPSERITTRNPAIRTFGNWILGLAELYIRNPKADRFAMFQDDFATYPNLRQYLEKSPYPAHGYLNLYTFSRTNEPLIRGRPVGWHEAGPASPKSQQWQAGRGAVALVFSNEAVRVLLGGQSLLDKPKQVGHRSYRSLDGAIVTALNMQGWREYIHNPSLVQHTGLRSSMGNSRHKLAETFRGEDFDALALLQVRP